MLVRRPGTAKRPDAGLRRVSMIHFFPIVLDGEKCLVLAIHGQMKQAIATLATRRHGLASPPVLPGDRGGAAVHSFPWERRIAIEAGRRRATLTASTAAC